MWLAGRDSEHGLSKIHLMHMPSWSSAFPRGGQGSQPDSCNSLAFVLGYWALIIRHWTFQFVSFKFPTANAQFPMSKFRGSMVCPYGVFEFTQDETCLEEDAYPILKGAAEFLVDYMREDKDGYLVIVPSTSPENSFVDPDTGNSLRITRGSTYHTTLVRVVLEAVLEASKKLNVDAALRGELETALGKLPPMKIGANGTIQEWIEDYEETAPKHRHVSHLIGLYPFVTRSSARMGDGFGQGAEGARRICRRHGMARRRA